MPPALSAFRTAANAHSTRGRSADASPAQAAQALAQEQ